MCFIHSEGLVSVRERAQPVTLSHGTMIALGELVSQLRSGTDKSDTRAGRPQATVRAAPDAIVLDGFSRVLHNRWNQDLPPMARVRQGEAVQFLCRDALDIGEAARTLTPEGVLTLDLGKIHPLTGPVAVEGAEPGDILEVEVLDVSPLVDFGYVVISPVLGLFGGLRPDLLAPTHQFTEASQLSDPSPGRVPTAIPEDQPFNSGAPFVQIFTFEKGQNSGFASFVGTDTAKRARIPIAPFMGIYGVAPLRKGMYRTVPPTVGGGNTDIKQFVKGARIQLPVYIEGARFSVGDGHMAQGDGEVCVTAIETLMAVTVRFQVIKNAIIESPRAIVPAADPTQLGLTKEMLAQGYYQTTGIGPDLMDNAKKSVRDMIDWLVRDQGLSIHEAYAICSVAGDLKISEVVDVPNWVVSMMMPRGIFQGN